MISCFPVIPANAGTQKLSNDARGSARTLPRASSRSYWVPAFAGMTMVLGATPTAVFAQDSYTIPGANLANLPYIAHYISCFNKENDIAKNALRAEGADESQLAIVCRKKRTALYEQAIAKFREAGSHDILDHKRNLKSAFDAIERRNPVPPEMLEAAPK